MKPETHRPHPGGHGLLARACSRQRVAGDRAAGEEVRREPCLTEASREQSPPALKPKNMPVTGAASGPSTCRHFCSVPPQEQFNFQPLRQAWHTHSWQFYGGAGSQPDGEVSWKVSRKALLTGQREEGADTSKHPPVSLVGSCCASSPSFPSAPIPRAGNHPSIVKIMRSTVASTSDHQLPGTVGQHEAPS